MANSIIYGEPRKIATDKLRIYGVAHRELMPVVIHSNEQYENNRAEQSHEVTRVRAQHYRDLRGCAFAEWSVAVA
jgi:putative transposase